MSKKIVFCATLVLAMTVLAIAQSSSKRITPDASKKIQQAGRLELKPAYERTQEQMDAFDATMAVERNERPEPAPRPTIDAALLARYKQQAAMAPHAQKPSGGNGAIEAPLTIKKFVGATECDGTGGCWFPPDVAGAIGPKNWVSASNDVIEIRSAGGVLQKINSLNGFFGYSTQSMFDPAVQYDEEYQRWIVTADAFAESSTVQYFGIAISQTNNATGKWWIYLVNTNNFTGTGSFYDYPHVGLSQDAVIVTANVFGSQSFLGAYVFGLAKARIYNGFGFSAPVFGGLYATLQPPHQVLTDQNGFAWLASAQPGSGTIQMYAFGYPANPYSDFSGIYGPYNVASAANSYPPGAAQPASCAPSGALLDSLDGRFQNAGTQNGDAYYQIHTTGDFGVPTPRYYYITGLLSFAPVISYQADIYGAGTTTNDFNPSIASDHNGNFAITWSSTDPANGINASMYFTDNKAGNPSGSTGTNVFKSASCYTGVGTSRWGDYSQVTIDPGTGAVANIDSKIFWITNETIPSANFWSTEVAKVPF